MNPHLDYTSQLNIGGFPPELSINYEEEGLTEQFCWTRYAQSRLQQFDVAINEITESDEDTEGVEAYSAGMIDELCMQQ